MPLDILMPYWGDPALAQLTVRSVLAQHNPDWLLTVVDDAYPDPTLREWLAGLGDARVRYVRQEHNRGITGSFRACIELATQDRVVIPGCDDVLLPNYVDVVLDAHRSDPSVEVIQPGVQVLDADGQVVRPLADVVKGLMRPRGGVVLAGEPLAAGLLRGDWLYWPSLAFRRQALVATPFQPGRRVIQDLALVIDLVAGGARLLVEPTVCFGYRRHESASAPGPERFAGEREYFRHAADQMAALQWRRARRAALGHWSSRLHAVSVLPRTVLSRPGDVPALLAHAAMPGSWER
ncbi:MAG: glycosyl transferase [Microbacterium sp. 14-71-5]|nr:MAG: glycosyl transferase [Microbacterium sp. 14-71-5]